MGGLIPLGDVSRRPARIPVVTILIILVNAFVFRKIGDGLPLRTRQAGVASLLLESLPHEAVDLMN